MSAYIVDDITINRIVAGLRFAADNPDDYNSPIPALTPELYGDGAQFSEVYGQALRQLNELAVSGRYAYCKADELPGPIDDHGKNPPYKYMPIVPPSPTQLFKSIRCFLYQCSEDATEGNTILTHLENYSKEICVHMMERSKEYENARWE